MEETIPEDVLEAAKAVAADIDAHAVWGTDGSWGLYHATAAHFIAGAILAERERCAKVADDYAAASWGLTEEEWAAQQIATSIRSGV